MKKTDAKKSVILFSTADWDNPFWTNKQHMALYLAERGYRILYVESIGLRKPTAKASDLMRIWRRLMRIFKSVRRVHPNIWVFSPFVIPFHSSAAVRRLNYWILRLSFFLLGARMGLKSPWVWTYHPLVMDYLKFLKFDKLIYHSVDDLTAAPRFPVEEIAASERQILQKADFIFVTSRTLQQKYERLTSRPIHYFPNVADFKHFSSARKNETVIPEELRKIPAPRIGFVGAISGYKVDFALINQVARENPSWHWVMIGKVGEGDPGTDVTLLSEPNIHLIGPKNYPSLPGYLKGFDVVVIPCVLNDYTRSMFPMKFFEYLAAGKVIVATEIPSLSEFKDLYHEAIGAEQFSKAISDVLAGHKGFTDKMNAAALENTWENRLDKMLQIVLVQNDPAEKIG